MLPESPPRVDGARGEVRSPGFSRRGNRFAERVHSFPSHRGACALPPEGGTPILCSLNRRRELTEPAERFGVPALAGGAHALPSAFTVSQVIVARAPCRLKAGLRYYAP